MLTMPYMTLSRFYLLSLTTNNPWPGFTEFLNIAHIHQVSFTTSIIEHGFGRIILGPGQEGPLSRVLHFRGFLLWSPSDHPFSARQVAHRTKAMCCPEAAHSLLDHAPVPRTPELPAESHNFASRAHAGPCSTTPSALGMVMLIMLVMTTPRAERDPHKPLLAAGLG